VSFARLLQASGNWPPSEICIALRLRISMRPGVGADEEPPQHKQQTLAGLNGEPVRIVSEMVNTHVPKTYVEAKASIQLELDKIVDGFGRSLRKGNKAAGVLLMSTARPPISAQNAIRR